MSPEERDSPPKINLLDTPKTMEQIIDYFNIFRGVSGIFLGYITRKCLILSASVNDPSSNYATRDLEMIEHSPILVPGTRG